MRQISRLSFCAAVFILAACSSPEKRIRKNQAMFQTYAPETQEDIRAGRIRIGFTRDQVQLALGEPDHKFARTTDSGFREVWVYYDDSAVPVYGIYPRAAGRPDEDGTSAGEKSRMIFQDGKLIIIERHNR